LANKTIVANFSVVLNLFPSWNLISVPYPLSITSISGLLAGFWYNDYWLVPAVLLLEEAYWLQMEEAGKILLSGNSPSLPINIFYQAGGQLFGNPLKVPLFIESILNHNSITACYSYNSQEGWEVMDLITGTFEPRKGYWIFLSSAGELIITHP
jgi:hypothetical protein